MKKLVLLAAVAAVALTACQQKPAAPKATAGAVPVKFNNDIPMTEFMGHMVDPAAYMYWSHSGTEENAQGTKELSPAPDDNEGWDVLVSGATILMAAGNELQLEGRARAPVDHWNKYAQDLTARALDARIAAEKHDKDGAYREGARVYEVCVACHEEFVIQPSIKANGPAKGNPLPDWPKDILAKIQEYEKAHSGAK